MEKVRIDNLIIEITRRCNMRCEHCMRGAAQRVDIQKKYITEFLHNVDSIYTLSITGGEPSLNVDGIRFLLKELKRLKIEVNNFYIVTNGSRSSMSQPFIDVCMDLYRHQEQKVSDGEYYPMLQMSDDEYHNQELHHKVVGTLDVYKFFSVRNNRYNKDNLLKEGRSKYGKTKTICPLSIDDEQVEGDVYLNALGYITSDCDMSYKTQSRKKLCHYSEFMQYLKTIA